MLRLDDKWVWDMWFAESGADKHMFFQQASKRIGDPNQRHLYCSVGHAVSTDYRNWQVLSTALAPATEPAWDDYAIWTGSVIQEGELWYLFYTAISRSDHGLKQRIGLATSSDLQHWQRHPSNPIMDIDTRWYASYDANKWFDQSLRDPYVIRDPLTDGFRMYFTSRATQSQSGDGYGVVGVAYSKDLLHWDVQAPVTPTGYFEEVEVPQFIEIEGRYYLIFCNIAPYRAVSYASAMPAGTYAVTGTHYFMAEHPDGPWQLKEHQFFAGDESNNLYSGKIIHDPQGGLALIGFYNNASLIGFDDVEEKSEFEGIISDPIPIQVDSQGYLHLQLDDNK